MVAEVAAKNGSSTGCQTWKQFCPSGNYPSEVGVPWMLHCYLSTSHLFSHPLCVESTRGAEEEEKGCCCENHLEDIPMQMNGHDKADFVDV